MGHGCCTYRHYNPKLMFVAILETELAAIPPALLHFQLPTMLTDIAFSGTNLTSIPDNCHEYWTCVFNIILEASPGITEVPPSLTQMSWVARLSLVGNSISTITDDFSGENMFISIDLSENPLQALPGTLGASFGMAELSIKMTNISDISSEWMETYVDTPGWMILATGTPLCEKLHAGETALNGDPSMVATPLPLPMLGCLVICGFSVMAAWPATVGSQGKFTMGIIDLRTDSSCSRQQSDAGVDKLDKTGGENVPGARVGHRKSTATTVNIKNDGLERSRSRAFD